MAYGGTCEALANLGTVARVQARPPTEVDGARNPAPVHWLIGGHWPPATTPSSRVPGRVRRGDRRGTQDRPRVPRSQRTQGTPRAHRRPAGRRYATSNPAAHVTNAIRWSEVGCSNPSPGRQGFQRSVRLSRRGPYPAEHAGSPLHQTHPLPSRDQVGLSCAAPRAPPCGSVRLPPGSTPWPCSARGHTAVFRSRRSSRC